MGRNRATGLYPTLDGVASGEVLDHSAGFGTVIEHRIDIASTENGLAILGINRRQVEEVVINTGGQTFGEEGSDEVALAVEPALGGFFEHRLGGITKGGGGDGLAAAVNIAVIEPDRGHILQRVLNFGGVKLQLALDPFVIVLGGSRAQHNIFDPVGHRPTSGSARFDTDTPGGVAIFGNLLSQGHQFVPGLRNFVTSSVKCLLGVEDQRLAIRAAPNTSHNRAFFALHGAHIEPRLDIVLLQPGGVNHIIQVDDFAFSSKIRQQTRLREVDDIGSAAAFDRNADRSFEFFRTRIDNIDTGGIFKGFH